MLLEVGFKFPMEREALRNQGPLIDVRTIGYIAERQGRFSCNVCCSMSSGIGFGYGLCGKCGDGGEITRGEMLELGKEVV